MISVVIKYSTRTGGQDQSPYVIAFLIRSNGLDTLYYLRHGNVVPELFDAEAVRIRISNFDDWIQLQTAQRYSLRSILDMAEAFVSGMYSAYSVNDLKLCAEVACVTAVEEIFQTRLAAGYSAAYRVELSPPAELAHNIDLIRQHWDDVLGRLGKDGLHNYLSRWHRYCQYFAPANAQVFERFLDRLKLQPADPRYPDTASYDAELRQHVVRRVLQKAGTFKGVPTALVKTAHQLAKNDGRR